LRSNYIPEHILKRKHIQAMERYAEQQKFISDPSVTSVLSNLAICGTLEPNELAYRLQLVRTVMLSGMNMGKLKYLANFLQQVTLHRRIPDPRNLTHFIPVIEDIEINNVKYLLNGTNLYKPTRLLTSVYLDGI
jgi:hypothetical protein